MLRRNRPMGGRHEIVDEPRDLFALALVPASGGVATGADVEMDIPIAEMAKAGCDHAGKLALDLGRRLDNETRHVGHGDRYVVRERLTLHAFSLRNAVADL